MACEGGVDVPSERLAARLKALRQGLGLTLQDVADLCGMRGGRAVVSKWERSHNPQRPDDDILLRLADFYGVSLDYLYDRPHATFASPAVQAALKRLHERLPEAAATGQTASQRLAALWRTLQVQSPGIFHPLRVAMHLNLSRERFEAVVAGQAEADPGVVARFAELVQLPEKWFYEV